MRVTTIKQCMNILFQPVDPIIIESVTGKSSLGAASYQDEISEFVPHNPFPDMQTLDFRIQRQPRLHDTRRCCSCVLPVEMKL